MSCTLLSPEDIYYSSLYLMDSIFNRIPYRASDQGRLSLLFAVIRIVFKTVDIVADNEDYCQKLCSKLKNAIRVCFEKMFSEQFGGGTPRYNEFSKLAEEFEVRVCLIVLAIMYTCFYEIYSYGIKCLH